MHSLLTKTHNNFIQKPQSVYELSLSTLEKGMFLLYTLQMNMLSLKEVKEPASLLIHSNHNTDNQLFLPSDVLAWASVDS